MNDNIKRWILEQLQAIVQTLKTEHSIDPILVAMVDTTDCQGVTIYHVNACNLDVASMFKIGDMVMVRDLNKQCNMVGHHPMCGECPKNQANRQPLPKKGACLH